MTKRKTHRSRCANETCGKQFRHADPAAKACSSNCKQVLYRIRRKAKEEAEQERESAAETQRVLERLKQQAQRQGAPTTWSATTKRVEKGSPPSQPARHLYHLVDADGLGRCGIPQVGEDHVTTVKEFVALATMGVALCSGCVSDVNRARRERRPKWTVGLADPAPEAGVITITMPTHAPMTPLGRRH